MKQLASLALLSVALAAAALAQDRTLTVLEASIIVRAIDVAISPSDGSCEMVVYIDPVADQRPAKKRKMPKELCESLKKSAARAAKLDQGVGNKAPP